uniref:Uncharacterized protein n=1 Tax=Ciona intestinalis TaxID=7719 RepID=H2XN63_CIOIN
MFNGKALDVWVNEVVEGRAALVNDWFVCDACL